MKVRTNLEYTFTANFVTYKVGDYVKVDGIEGYVEDINIRSTKIRDLDNFLIELGNGFTYIENEYKIRIASSL